MDESKPLALGQVKAALQSVMLGTQSGRKAGLDTQGLTLVHFSAQLEPLLTHKNALKTLNTPQYPLNMGYTTPTPTPYPIKSAQGELRSERV